MYTPTRIAGREAVFEFLPEKLRAYPFIYIDALQNVAATSCETNMYCGPKKTDDGVAEMLRVLYRKTEAGWTCSAGTLRAKKSTCFSCFLRSCMNPTRSSRIRQVGPIFCRCRDHQHVRSSAD